MASTDSATARGIDRGSARARALDLGHDRRRLVPARLRPSSSLSWLAKMMTAMPAVKPTVTG